METRPNETVFPDDVSGKDDVSALVHTLVMFGTPTGNELTRSLPGATLSVYFKALIHRCLMFALH